jgi:UDP-3-O-[3-hydroxymyristoyl] N-acetylglucosamine deacetylase
LGHVILTLYTAEFFNPPQIVSLMQHTLRSPVTLTGIGLHSGAETTLTLKPAEAHSGIQFVRVDVTDRLNKIPAKWDHVVDTQLCTMLGNESGVRVGTVEHLLAALRACGVDNVVVELDGPEVPIMDGSSEPFVEALRNVGLKTQTAPRLAIKILKEISVTEGDKHVSLKPAAGSRFKSDIEFSHPAIGRQSYEAEIMNGQFLKEISDARTFGFMKEVAALRAQGLALGGSLDNAIVLDDDKILNSDGLRHNDEFARHKLLDAVGDLYLAGAPIIGFYEGFKAGHALNNQILKKLFATPDAWTLVELFMDVDLLAAHPQPLPKDAVRMIPIAGKTPINAVQ